MEYTLSDERMPIASAQGGLRRMISLHSFQRFTPVTHHIEALRGWRFSIGIDRPIKTK
jgi:hypothetical protein